MNLPVGSKTAGPRAPLRFDVPLSRYSTFQIGGPARYFSEPSNLEEVQALLHFAREEGQRVLTIGKGSNLLFPDEGFPGLVLTFIRFEPRQLVCDREAGTVTASSGTNLYRLALAARDAGLSGIEFLGHIPGTLGGALRMNAGFSRFSGQKKEIGDYVEEVTVLAQGEVRRIGREKLEFGYRKSGFGEDTILGARLKLSPADPKEIQSEIQANFDYRNRVQDLRHPSAGSVFKNPGSPLGSSGQLIENAGLKGTRRGGAMISDRHANFIVNTGGAKASEVLELIEQAQQKVFERFGVRLEPEVRIIRNSS